MRRIIAAFKDPVRRPRALVLTALVLVGFSVFYGVANLATSTAWFCNDVCHVVHLDNAKAWRAGSHSQISCMACHYPADINQLELAFDRVDKLADIPPTVLGDFHMPMNEWSHVALTTPDLQCTQCHAMENRIVTPSEGIIIDHDAHTAEGIVCAACHNRVAHPESDIEIELPDNARKADFMTMTACYRCHSLGDSFASEYRAPGECATCHTAGFDLVPPSHDAAGWYAERGESKGHAAAAREESSRTADAQAVWASAEEEFYERDIRLFAKLAGVGHEILVKVPPPSTIDECTTCHARAYCDGCHGLSLPHPAEFVDGHGADLSAPADAAACGVCHNKSGVPANDRYTCTLCHHPGFQPEVGAWRTQHDDIIKAGADVSGQCFDCHQPLYCESCHVSGKPSTAY